MTNIELVTHVVANATHIRYAPIRRGESSGPRSVQLGDVADDRKDRSRATRRVRRGERREREIGEGDRVAEAERPATEMLDEEQRDTAAEPRLLVAHRDDERREDQPDRAVGESRERPFQRPRPEHEMPDRRAVPGLKGKPSTAMTVTPISPIAGRGQRLGDQREDDGDEGGEVTPGVWRRARRASGRQGNRGAGDAVAAPARQTSAVGVHEPSVLHDPRGHRRPWSGVPPTSGVRCRLRPARARRRARRVAAAAGLAEPFEHHRGAEDRAGRDWRCPCPRCPAPSRAPARTATATAARDRDSRTGSARGCR